jgi:CHAT domain-containing protein
LEATNGVLKSEELDQPSATQVTESSKRCSIAHFACHGSSNRADPSNSGLVFQTSGGPEPSRQDVMTVHSVSELNSKHGQIDCGEQGGEVGG